MPEKHYYKGYTQHLISTKGDTDTDNSSLLVMNMVPGLFVSNDAYRKDGYILPICKYINRKIFDIASGMNVVVDVVKPHPKYEYATIEKDITLYSPSIIPNHIAGGIVVIHNLFNTKKCPSGYDLLDGNLNELINNGDISVIFDYKDGGKQGKILLVHKPCTLKISSYTYPFSFMYKNSSYVDFVANVN